MKTRISKTISVVILVAIGVMATILVVLSSGGAPAVHAATFTVVNINDNDAGSLRQAILDANASAGPDTITFNIPGAGPQTIRIRQPSELIERRVLRPTRGRPG